MQLPNLARRVPEHPTPERLRIFEEVDAVVETELRSVEMPEVLEIEAVRGVRTEVPTKFFGAAYGWTFKRAWRYWVAEGPGVPPEDAERFYKTWGREVRVLGDGNAQSPQHHCHGFAVGFYHIDTLGGLSAFVRLLGGIYKP